MLEYQTIPFTSTENGEAVVKVFTYAPEHTFDCVLMDMRMQNIQLFVEYHPRYPFRGYRWLNAKIRLDTGLILSDPYAHTCCKTAGIKSESKHNRYKKPGEPYRILPNLLLAEFPVDGPLQCIVSDMTAFCVKGVYHALTLCMDVNISNILYSELER